MANDPTVTQQYTAQIEILICLVEYAKDPTFSMLPLYDYKLSTDPIDIDFNFLIVSENYPGCSGPMKYPFSCIPDPATPTFLETSMGLTNPVLSCYTFNELHVRSFACRL